MEDLNNHIDDLIAKYLGDEASQEEILFITNWRQQSSANERHFSQVKFLFDKAASASHEDFNTDIAWQKLRVKIANNSAKTKKFPGLYDNKYFRIAATVLLFAAVGLAGYKFFGTRVSEVELVSEKTIKTDTLPGGTEVVVNKASRLAYKFNKRKKQHQVKLEGEAFFEIKHQPEERFIVEAEQVFIEDIGTAFNVKAYPKSNTIEVFVEEGEVRLYTNRDEGISVKAGQKGIYDRTSQKFSIATPVPNEASYKSRVFTFTNTTLGEIVMQLNTVYNDSITINERLSNCRLTVNFNNERVEEITSVIAETLGVIVTKTPNGYRLDGAGCSE